jgi:hypothetical protein
MANIVRDRAEGSHRRFGFDLPGGTPGGCVDLCWRLAWFGILVAGYTHGNDFPAAWHFDEPDKVAQVVNGERDFHHPLLLLMLTKVGARLGGVEHTLQIGRWVSALAAAAAVDLMALLAGSLAGRLARVLAAVLVGTSPLLFGLAHYMKEDTLLLLGVSAFLLALIRYQERPSHGFLALLGSTAGMAASAKYVGAMTIPIALGVIIWEYRKNWTAAIKPCLVVLGAAGAVFLVVNMQIFREFYAFRTGLGAEIRHITTSHQGLIRPPRSLFYADALYQSCGPGVLCAAALWLVYVLCEPRRQSMATCVIAAWSLAYLAMLQLSPVKIVRYELPVVAIMAMLAACGFALLLAREHPWVVRGAAGVGIALVLVFNLWGVAATRAAIDFDSRAEMAQWIRTHLPTNAVLGEERIAGIAGRTSAGFASNEVPLKVIAKGNAAEFGSLEEAASIGVSYILVSDLTFGRFFNDTFDVDRGDPESAIIIERRRSFYRALFEKGKLVHRVEAHTPVGTFFSPGLWLFCITPGNADVVEAAESEPPIFHDLQD